MFTSVVVYTGDDTMKLWDLRNYKKPVNVADNLPNVFLT